MPSVGPQLPSHLTKRKRSIDDGDGESSISPPTKVQAACSPEPRRVPGPAAPPPTRNEEEIALSSPDEEDDYGPSPSLKPSKAPKISPPPRRVLGPAPPPAPLSEKPSQPADEDENCSSDEDDDDYGPSLPPPPGSAAEASMLRQREETEASLAASAATSELPLKRAEWMLIPPSDSDWGSRVDPTKLKNRRFASGKGAKGPGEKGGISTIWTETPEEKRRRLEDEVLGRKEVASSSRANRGVGSPVDRDELETERRIREYNERNRGRSLMEEHKNALPKVKEDDPSKRAFDKEKDIGLGGRIGHVQKREMLGKAADFGSRFQKGKYL